MMVFDIIEISVFIFLTSVLDILVPPDFQISPETVSIFIETA